MITEVVDLIGERRFQLLLRIIEPHIPNWPAEQTGVSFRHGIGITLIYVCDELVGGIDERPENIPAQYEDIKKAVRQSLVGWKKTSGIAEHEIL